MMFSSFVPLLVFTLSEVAPPNYGVDSLVFTSKTSPLDNIGSILQKPQVQGKFDKDTMDHEVVTKNPIDATPLVSLLSLKTLSDPSGQSEQQEQSPITTPAAFDCPTLTEVDALVDNVGALDMSHDADDAQVDAMLIDNSSHEYSDDEAQQILRPRYRRRHAVSEHTSSSECENEDSFELAYPDADTDVGLVRITKDCREFSSGLFLLDFQPAAQCVASQK
jgi:hypothetical protein